ncbi:hypothetical protein [Streptomyces xantholiticus]
MNVEAAFATADEQVTQLPWDQANVGAVRGPDARLRISGRAGPPVGAGLVVVGDH